MGISGLTGAAERLYPNKPYTGTFLRTTHVNANRPGDVVGPVEFERALNGYICGQKPSTLRAYQSWRDGQYKAMYTHSARLYLLVDYIGPGHNCIALLNNYIETLCYMLRIHNTNVFLSSYKTL